MSWWQNKENKTDKSWILGPAAVRWSGQKSSPTILLWRTVYGRYICETNGRFKSTECVWVFVLALNRTWKLSKQILTFCRLCVMLGCWFHSPLKPILLLYSDKSLSLSFLIFFFFVLIRLCLIPYFSIISFSLD